MIRITDSFEGLGTGILTSTFLITSIWFSISWLLQGSLSFTTQPEGVRWSSDLLPSLSAIKIFVMAAVSRNAKSRAGLSDVVLFVREKWRYNASATSNSNATITIREFRLFISR